MKWKKIKVRKIKSKKKLEHKTKEIMKEKKNKGCMRRRRRSEKRGVTGTGQEKKEAKEEN